MRTTFTLEEFLQQVGHFRELMTNKAFMEGPEEKQNIAISALHFAYTRVEGTKEDLESAATFLQSTCYEFGQRKAFVTMRPLRKALGMAH